MQQSLSVDEKLRILLDKEEKINEGEKAHLARRRVYRRNSDSNTSMTDFNSLVLDAARKVIQLGNVT